MKIALNSVLESADTALAEVATHAPRPPGKLDITPDLAAQSCVLVSTSQLRVVPHEFVFGAQPVFDVVVVLPAT